MEETTNESITKSDKSNLENQLKGLDISDSALNELDIDLDNEISDEAIDKYVKKLKEKFEKNDEFIDEHFETLKKEVGSRIDEIKVHLDNMQGEMLATIASIKVNTSEEIEKLSQEADHRTSDYELFAEQMQNKLEMFDQNRDTLKQDLYQCQDKIEELMRLEDRFHEILRKVSFEPSDWLPDNEFIKKYIINIDLSSDDEQGNEKNEVLV